jgi:phage terminase small subunit
MKKKEKQSITPKRRRFIEEYIVDCNGTQAAIRAGYAPKAANEQAAYLLAVPSVRAEVDRILAEKTSQCGAEASRVIAELVRLSFYDPGEIGKYPINGPADIALLPEDLRRCIIGWSWDKNNNFTLKLAPKTPNLELIGRNLGMFRDKVEHTGSGFSLVIHPEKRGRPS